MTLKMTPEEKIIRHKNNLKINMKKYYTKNQKEHSDKCRERLNNKYKNDPEFRLKVIEKTKARYQFKKEFKTLCAISV